MLTNPKLAFLKRSLFCWTFMVVSLIPFRTEWIVERNKIYELYYTSSDAGNKKAYKRLLQNGQESAVRFFGSAFDKKFDVYIHPDRNSIDSTWQKDWKMPDFKSECWMVASGVAKRLDVISPKKWDVQACEHRYSDSDKTQKLITHELVHVFHGQHNASPDFGNLKGLDWFVEGLATFASGQCDDVRISEVKKAVAENKIPKSLDDFWTGKIKYGLSGSVVKFIDHEYGRAKLIDLLKLRTKTQVLSELKLSETELLDEWKLYVNGL